MRSRSLCSLVTTFAVVLGIHVLGTSAALAQWTPMQQLTAKDGASYDTFGSSIAISGNTAIVGAPNADKPFATDVGAVYVFVHDGTNWVQKQKLMASDGAASDLFGSSLAIDGSVIVVGAPRADVAGSDSGAAYVFRLSGSTWIEESK